MMQLSNIPTLEKSGKKSKADLPRREDLPVYTLESPGLRHLVRYTVDRGQIYVHTTEAVKAIGLSTGRFMDDFLCDSSFVMAVGQGPPPVFSPLSHLKAMSFPRKQEATDLLAHLVRALIDSARPMVLTVVSENPEPRDEREGEEPAEFEPEPGEDYGKKPSHEEIADDITRAIGFDGPMERMLGQLGAFLDALTDKVEALNGRVSMVEGDHNLLVGLKAYVEGKHADLQDFLKEKIEPYVGNNLKRFMERLEAVERDTVHLTPKMKAHNQRILEEMSADVSAWVSEHFCEESDLFKSEAWGIKFHDLYSHLESRTGIRAYNLRCNKAPTAIQALAHFNCIETFRRVVRENPALFEAPGQGFVNEVKRRLAKKEEARRAKGASK